MARTDGGFTGAVVGSRAVRQYHTDYAAHILGRIGSIRDREEQAKLNEPYSTATLPTCSSNW